MLLLYSRKPELDACIEAMRRNYEVFQNTESLSMRGQEVREQYWKCAGLKRSRMRRKAVNLAKKRGSAGFAAFVAQALTPPTAASRAAPLALLPPSPPTLAAVPAAAQPVAVPAAQDRLCSGAGLEIEVDFADFCRRFAAGDVTHGFAAGGRQWRILLRDGSPRAGFWLEMVQGNALRGRFAFHLLGEDGGERDAVCSVVRRWGAGVGWGVPWEEFLARPESYVDARGTLRCVVEFSVVH